MALPDTLQDREMQKFFADDEGLPTVRTSGRGTFTPSGLQSAGRVTEVDIDDTSWTALPPIPLTGRNAISIQNVTGFTLKVNYRNDVAYVGMIVPNGNERYYDIKDTITIYARAQPGSGTVTLNVEELA
jgi:hypothetical protein